MQKYLPIVVAALLGCGHVTSAPVLTPPGPAIVALAPPPGTVVPPKTQVHQHAHWSLELPSSWKIDHDDDDGLSATSDANLGRAPMSVMVLTTHVDDATTTPEQYATIMSLMANKLLPDGVTPTGVERGLIDFNGRPASITEIHTDKDVAVGVLAVLQPETHTGYVNVCVSDLQFKPNAHLCADIAKTLTLR